MLEMLTLSAREVLLGNALLKRLQDHFVFLNDSHAADALVVRDRLIVGRHKADNILVPARFQNVDADMPV